MTVIGITGPTGAGKTTALRELEGLGGCILDTDAIYHQLLESNHTLQKELEFRFGNMLDGQGEFDRKKLGAMVFHDRSAMADLNEITHRHISAALKDRLAQAQVEGRPAAAIDAIRLFESGADQLCHTTVAVIAPLEVRVRRIVAREGISQDYARARVAAQQPDEFYTGRCAHVLVNDCASAQEFAQRARALFASILSQYAN